MMRGFLVVAMTLLVAATSAPAGDWPQFRGPTGDGLSPEKGLLQSWPEGGPKVLWENTDIGSGWSSVAVVKGTVYTLGHVGEGLMVTAIDPQGKKLWQVRLDKATNGGGHKGARCTPTIDGQFIYVQSDGGLVACLKAANGEQVWALNYLEKYKAKQPTWNVAESPLVDGARVIVTPGGEAALVALDKNTGQEVWKTEAVDAKPGYASARIMDYGGLRQVIGYSEKCVFAANAADGKLLWKLPQENKWFVNATSAVWKDGIVFSTCDYGFGCQGIKVEVADGKATARQIWAKKVLDDHFGGVVLLGGKVYGTGTNSAGLTAIDLATGEVAYTSREVKKSSNIYGDGRLYCQGHDGTVQLVNPADGKVVSKFTLEVKQKGEMWAHPAISDGRLYIRHDSTLSVYDIKAAR